MILLATLFGTGWIGTAAQQPTMPTPQPQLPGLPPPPSRTPARAPRPGEDPQKGTAILRGYVTAADSGNPLRRALVRANSQDGSSAGMAITDGQGRFEIKELKCGRYNLNASKAGYVSMSYGQRRPEQQGTLLEIANGQMADKIAFTLPRGGVITGRVFDEYGEAIAGAQVSAMRFRYMNGARRLMPTGNSSTDDLGSFRIYGLMPGEYYVSGNVRSPNQMMIVNGAPAASNVPDGFATTYFPGTPNPAEATRVTVKVGQETANIAFGLIAARTSRITGRAISSSGEAIVQAFITAMPADRFAGGMPGMNNAMTRADGTFQISGLAPGTYNVTVRPRGMPDANAEFANVRVTVGNDDVDNVLLVTARGGIARGVVTTDDNTPLPVRPQQVSIFARPLEPDIMIMSGESKVFDDWTFELTGLSEARVITANVAEASEWSLKAVMLNGQNVIDTPLEFLPGHTVEALQVVFSRKRTDLSGVITGERNGPETDATVIVFSQDPERWGYATRYVRIARPSQDGRYSLKGMPPHDYFVVAVKDIEMGQWQDPEFLDTMRAQAVRVSLDEGETKVQDLKVSRPQ